MAGAAAAAVSAGGVAGGSTGVGWTAGLGSAETMLPPAGAGGTAGVAAGVAGLVVGVPAAPGGALAVAAGSVGAAGGAGQGGRTACREREWTYGWISVVAGPRKNKTDIQIT